MGIFLAHAIEKKFHLPPTAVLEYPGALATGTACFFMIDAPIMAIRSRYFRPALGLGCAIAGYALIAIGVLFFVGRHVL